MARSLMSAVWLIAAANVASPCAAAEMRPFTPGWLELTVAKESGGVAVQSRIDSDVIGLKLRGGQVEVLRTDLPIFAVDKLQLGLEHLALVAALRGKPDAALSAYHDFVNSDLQKRGWKEAAAERARFSAGGKVPAIYWAMQAEGSSGGKTASLTFCLAAAVAGSSIVAMSGLAEDGPSAAAIKRILTETLATLDLGKGTALPDDLVARLRSESQRLVHRIASRGGVILLNDELASAQDRKPSSGTQHYILSANDMAEAAAAAVAGSPNGSFMTFVNDGRSQHVILIDAYDPATASFQYSDTTGSHSLLEAGNNLAGVEAQRSPNGLWVVKKEQLKAVLTGMIVSAADLLAVQRSIHLGPFGLLGNTPADAKQTDFFKYFRLEETGTSAGPDGGKTISYAPAAAKFRPLVRVRLHLAPPGWIRGADLTLKRRFIEDARDESSARDIAKSFLEAGSIKEDWDRIHRLHDEIFYLGSTKMFIGEAAAKNISIPLLPSDGYLAFAGRHAHFVDMLSRSRLWIENVSADGEPALFISIGSGS
jgi:hypothetical protein